MVQASPDTTAQMQCTTSPISPHPYSVHLCSLHLYLSTSLLSIFQIYIYIYNVYIYTPLYSGVILDGSTRKTKYPSDGTLRGEEEKGAIYVACVKDPTEENTKARWQMTNLLQNEKVDGATATLVDRHKGIVY